MATKPMLIILTGISASGKSQTAKRIALIYNVVVVSSDAIREEICEGGVSDQSKNGEVFKIFHRRIKENLLKGNNVIADSTGITIKTRRAIFDAVKDIDCYKIGYVIAKRIEDCLRDNKNSDRSPVPEEVIYKQANKFQIPFMEEGYDNIVVLCYSDMDNERYFQDILCNMEGFDQKNPNHTQTLDKHCGFTYNRFCKMYKYSYPYRLAAIVHDYGKLFVQTFDDDGIAHYYGHANRGAYELLSNYNNFIFNDTFVPHEVLDFLFLVNYHMIPFGLGTESAKNKWRKIFGDYKYQLLMDFYECDKMRPEDSNLSELSD